MTNDTDERRATRIADYLLIHGIPLNKATMIARQVAPELRVDDEAAGMVLVPRSALTELRGLFSDIRGDYTDPRHECRAGWAIIVALIEATEADNARLVGD